MRIPARFNGPPDSGNGGYTCGLVAVALGAEGAEVSLRSPPPLERELEAAREGDRVVMRDGDTLVAEGVAIAAELPAPPPTDLAAARGAARKGDERWFEGHPFPTCFTCGPDRPEGDGLRIFPVELEEGGFAAEWTPTEEVPPEQIWAALDCPTAAPVMNPDKDPPIVLARLAASIVGTVTPGEPHLLLSWELERDGRKRHSACALFDPEGSELARSRALWIELRPQR
jgi:hypothetical protein